MSDGGQQRTRPAGCIAAALAVVVALYAVCAGFEQDWFWLVLDCVGVVAFSYVALWNFGIVKYTFKGIRRR